MAEDFTFNTEAARKAGASDADIASFLAPKSGFDLEAARNAGATDSMIVDFLAPRQAPPPKPEPSASGTIGGIGKAIGQQVLKLPGGIVETAGSTAETAALLDEANSRKQLDIYDKIDRGEKIKPLAAGGMGYRVDQDLITANKYMGATPDEKAELRAKAAGNLKAQPGMLEETGQKLRHAGEKMQEWAERAIPLTPEEEGRTSVQVTKMLTSMVPYVAAAVTTGGAGLVAYGGLEALNRTYGEALKSGADPEQAAKAAVENGTAQGLLNMIPAAHAAKIMERLPQNVQGKFVQLLSDAALGAGNMLTVSQVGQIAENAVASKTIDPNRPAFQGVGENMGPAAIAGAILPVGAAAAGRAFRPRAKTPAEIARPIMEAPDTDSAIKAAQDAVAVTPSEIDTQLTQAREFGGEAEQQQASLNKLFGGLNEGTVEQAPDGTYQFNKGEQIVPLKVWEPEARSAEGEGPTISPELVAAQRAHYEGLGVKVVYFENDNGIPFDGAVDPKQPDTIFLSNNPTRNAAQVGAHELTHLLESTRLPDGTNLGDLLHSQISEGATGEGLEYAGREFGSTAPDVAAFPATPEGRAAHADAVMAHLIRELGADIGGEAPKFQTFVPRVVEAVEARYGAEAAKGVLQKLIAGIQQTMRTLREFFSKPAEGAEYGQPETQSQKWVTNLEQVHDTLAKMYAERYQTQVEREQAKLESMRPVREVPATEAAPRAIPAEPAPEARAGLPEGVPEAPPPEAPVGFFDQRPEPSPAPGYSDARDRAERLERWLGELEADRRQKAADSPQVQQLQATVDTILGKVKGVEDRLTKAAAERLRMARERIEELSNPTGDSHDMALVRAQLAEERQRMADAAAVGTGPAPSMERAGRPQTAGVARRGPAPIRGRAVMPEVAPERQAPPAAAAVERPAPPVIAPVAETPQAAPAIPASPTADLDAKVRAAKEAVWADKTVMGGTRRGIPRNENFAMDVARERIMREEVGQEAIADVIDRGVPADAMHEISRMYRRAGDETPIVAFDAAVDRWLTKEEARAALAYSDGDVATFDHLKAAAAGGDPVIAEAFARLEEHYGGRQDPGHDIPFGAEPAQAPAGDRGEVAREPSAGRGSAEAGGESGRRSALPAEQAELAVEAARERWQRHTEENERKFGSDLVGASLERRSPEWLAEDERLYGELKRLERGPSFSPRRSELAQTQPLIDAREPPKEELSARQRQVEKERAQLQMQGKARKAGQEAPDDLPLFGGDRQGVLFSPSRERDEQGRFTHDFHANPDRVYTPEQERFNQRQRAVDVPTWGDWWAKVSDRPLQKLAVELVDRYASLRKRDWSGYMWSRIANSSVGGQAVWLTEGTLKINGRAYDLDKRNGGARALLQPLQKEVYDFFFWIASHRAEELAKEDRENRFTPEDIKAGKTLNRGELNFDYTLSNGKTTRSREAAYQDSLAKLNTLNQNILDLSVKGGLLTKDVADVLMKNQFYVPFFRERADGTAEFVGPTSGMARQTFGQKLKGGTEKLNSDLVQNWVDNASHIIDAVAKNRAAAAVLEAGARDGIATRMTEQEYAHLSDKEKKAQSTWVMEDGKKQYYHVEDPMLLKAVGTLEALADPFYALSASRVARRVLQVGVTHNPVFAIRNLARDSMQALAVTPQSANVLKTIGSGIHDSDSMGALTNLARSVAGRDLEALKLSDDAVRALAGGGMMRIASVSDTGVSKVKLGSLLDTPEKLDGFLNGVGRAMHAYSEAVGAGETFNRIALYKKLRAEGVDHDIASFSAQDLTDFSLGGANVIVRYIRETVPFTNSRAQGLYKVGRALSGSDAAMFNALGASAAAPNARSAAAVTLLRTAGTLAGLTVATMALDALYSDDPEYQQRTEYDRQNYWWFKVGDVRARVPMPFEVGALSRIAADTALAFFDDRMSVNRWASNTWSSMQNNLGFGFTPQIIAPLIDVAWTGKTGTGQAIEPRGMENLQPDQRYAINSTMAARGASSAINSMLRALPGMGTVQGPSPLQLDYLTRAYGGWLGQASLGTADTAIRSFTSEPERPAGDTWATATQGLIETAPRNASRYIDALYQQAKSVEQAFATYKDIISRGQAAEAREFFDANKDLIQKHGVMSAVTRMEGDLNKQIRMIGNSTDPAMTPERKRLMIMNLSARKSQVAQSVSAPR